MRRGSRAPFIVFGDGGPMGSLEDAQVFTVLDSLSAAGRLPPMIAIGAGGQDAQGSERRLDGDAVPGADAGWVAGEVLPRAERQAGVELTSDSGGRATMGISVSGAPGLHRGPVPPRALPSRARLFAQDGQPAMAP